MGASFDLRVKWSIFSSIALAFKIPFARDSAAFYCRSRPADGVLA